jgi:Tfp pilus assembly protein PilF
VKVSGSTNFGRAKAAISLVVLVFVGAGAYAETGLGTKNGQVGRASKQVASASYTEKKIDPVPYYKRGLAYITDKKYDEAADEFKQALDCNPHYYQAWVKLALVYQLTGQTDRAIDEYKKILELRPDMADAHVNLGILLREKRQDSQALTEFRKAIQMNYYSLAAHYNLGNLLASNGYLKEALREFQTCLTISTDAAPESARVHNNIGVIYQKSRYLEEAEEEFLRALVLDPGNKTFESNLALVRRQLNKKPVGAYVKQLNL